nr:protein SIEVE ELEMENT OCCLUSION B-like [Ipomoea batatas]
MEMEGGDTVNPINNGSSPANEQSGQPSHTVKGPTISFKRALTGLKDRDNITDDVSDDKVGEQEDDDPDCPVVKLTKEEKRRMRKRWENTLIIKVLGKMIGAIETILNSEKVVDKVTTEEMLEDFDLKFRELSLKIQHLCFEGLDISNERIQFLNAFYYATQSTPYILWIPILDDHAAWSIEQYEEFRDKMSFQIMDDPHKIARSFTRFVKENFLPHFQIGEEPILVSLDQHGRIVHTNAMHMIQTWSDDYIEDNKLRVEAPNNIIPFIKKEMKERSQGLDSLIFDIAEQINHLAREVDDKIDGWADQINDRLNKLGATMEGWAVLSKGQKVVVCGQGAKMLRVINEYESWKENIALKSFDQAFKDYYNKTLHTCCSSNSHSCCAFEYPITLKEIPKKEKCPECFHDMQKFVTFTCYHGDS